MSHSKTIIWFRLTNINLQKNRLTETYYYYYTKIGYFFWCKEDENYYSDFVNPNDRTPIEQKGCQTDWYYYSCLTSKKSVRKAEGTLCHTLKL